MLVVALMVVSVRSDIIHSHRQRSCMTTKSDTPAAGDLAIVAECDPTDPKHSKWVVNTLSGSSEQNPYVIQICIQGSTLCVGTIDPPTTDSDGSPLNPLRQPTVRLLTQSSSDTAQQWTVNPSEKRPDQNMNSYINVKTNNCLIIDGSSRDGKISTESCRDGDRRQMWAVSSTFNINPAKF